ncbi:MAG: phage antirepressor N-terminal domain-containing protein [Victivallaceae bacterium]
MNEIIKVPFCENEIIVIEKDKRRYVPLKPLVEALKLNWVAQYELVNRDPVLSKKGIRVTVPTNGGPQEMFALELEYLNGWLFKIPARRYSGQRRETIIRYQKECYNALYNYFHKGGAVNPNLSAEQIPALVGELVERINRRLDSDLDELNQELTEINGKLRNQSLKKFFDNRVPK